MMVVAGAPQALRCTMNVNGSVKRHPFVTLVARQDGVLFDLICSRRTVTLNRLMIFATRSGDAVVYLALAIVGAVIGGETGASLLSVATGAGIAAALCYVPKRLIARPRPTRSSALRVALLEPPDAWSFPSSHTATAFAAACAIGTSLGPV